MLELLIIHTTWLIFDLVSRRWSCCDIDNKVDVCLKTCCAHWWSRWRVCVTRICMTRDLSWGICTPNYVTSLCDFVSYLSSCNELYTNLCGMSMWPCVITHGLFCYLIVEYIDGTCDVSVSNSKLVFWFLVWAPYIYMFSCVTHLYMVGHRHLFDYVTCLCMVGVTYWVFL